MARYAHPEDFDAAADDFLDLNFIAYHSAWPYQNELAQQPGTHHLLTLLQQPPPDSTSAAAI
jgi:hypothetical protein